MYSDYDHITFPIPDMKFEGDALVSRQKYADWRLICIPGAPSQTFLFKRLLQLASTNLEIVVVNRLGYGKMHDVPILDFNEQSKIVEPFLGDKRIVLLGISYGGVISLKAALNYQDDIEGVVTGAALVSEPRNYAKAIVDFDKFDFLKPITPRRLQHMRAEIKGRRVQMAPLLEELKGLNIPIEVLHGTLDTLVPKDDAQTLIKAIGKNAHYQELVGGTHYLEMQMPLQILKAVDRVIKKNNN